MASLKNPATIAKIAVLFPEFLGDYINLIPFLHRLGDLFPAAEVTLYISPNMVEFAGNHPRVHRCFPFPNRGTVAERNSFVSALRAEKYDMAYFTNPDLLWVVVRAKIPLRIHEHSDFLFKLLCKGTPMSAFRNRFRQVPERHIHNLDYLFGDRLPVESYNFDAGISPDPCDLVSDLPRYVALNPDSHSCKRFDRNFFVQIITWLMANGHTVVHVGLKDPHGLDQDFGNNPQYRYLVGKTSLPQLMGIFRYADLFLGIDSGTAHLASILGTPTLILYPPKGVTPAVSCLLGTKALPYQYAAFDSTCELACQHYPSCAFDTSTHDYNVADVKSRILETMAARLSPDERWRIIYQTSVPILVIPVADSDTLRAEVAGFAKSGISIRLGSSDMRTWSFSRMLAFMYRNKVRVIFWEGGAHVPFKWKVLNRWMRFSERLFCGMTAGVLDDTPAVFFDRCYAALVGAKPFSVSNIAPNPQ